MHRVITINLNGNAYQLDEPGYDALHGYMADAELRLAGNPDRAEIITDLEQAVAERCRSVLGPGKTVVSSSDIEQILREIGPVDGGATSTHAAPTGGASGRRTDDPSTKRLYQIREGAMLSGVCNGLGAYFDIDPTFFRVGFVVLTIFHGSGILLYLLLMILIPYAKTSEELAAAQEGNVGLPFRVQRIVEAFRRKFLEKPWWKKKAV